MWHGGVRGEPALLASCYEQSMILALEHGIDSVAFPAISCGVYGYPPELAAPVALRSLGASMPAGASMQVLICCFGDAMASIWRAALNDAG